MKQAEDNIEPNWKAENFSKTNNCQNYIIAMKKEYNRLKKTSRMFYRYMAVRRLIDNNIIIAKPLEEYHG